MRLIHTFTKADEGKRLVSYLQSQGIKAQTDIQTEKDWGQDSYGDHICRVWVVDEDDTLQAKQLLQEFLNNPNEEKFQHIPPPSSTSSDDHSPPQVNLRAVPTRRPTKPMGPVTLYLLLTCVWIFIWSHMTAPPLDINPENLYLPPTPLFTSPIHKELMYDYPEQYALIDQTIKEYGRDEVLEFKPLPAEGKQTIRKALEMKTWNGYYNDIVQSFKGNAVDWVPKATLFEKIRQGQWWRTFTPALLHSDIFHILFNMLWLIILGQQLEKRLKAPRYLIFILIAGILSNTAQYMMSGPNFIGFSGVLTAMFGFIWVRQLKAPWEGYEMQSSTLLLITIFILGLLAIQIGSFIGEVYYDTSFSPPIANTAHISGALVGMIFGLLPFYKMR